MKVKMTHHQVFELLSNWRGLDSLKQLFWQELNYNRVMSPLARKDWAEGTLKLLADDPLIFAQTGARNDFHILYLHLSSDRLRLTDERQVVNRLLREHLYGLFVFSDRSQMHWHFVNVREGAKREEDSRKVRRILRRIAVGPDERLRTASERIAMLNAAPFVSASPLEIQNRHDEAFDVEAVTNQFFKHYQYIFSSLQEHLNSQHKDPDWSHDYALQFLNRLMFLYFIQRKRWLGGELDFIKRIFWESYKDSEQPRDSFFEKWLSVLFFEAFNEKFQAGRSDRSYLPDRIRNALALAPYLNGGLFTQNELDTKHSFTVSDETFEHLFDRFDGQDPGFLERYNFTISEDTPFDQEVAVDPEMIGKIYERLVNITFEGIEERDLRGTAGIFYTPRVEIDLMCRLALVDWLSNRMGKEDKGLLYQAVFAYDPEEKQEADETLAHKDLWPQLNNLLRNITILDPACGSGSFLVSMLLVLDDLQARAGEQLGDSETPYERRRRIIGQSLYGVDVMDWAVHVAELRLWLQLVIETELKPAELKFHPLLPNLSFKVRPGDSLVQEIGGINLGLHRAHLEIPAPLKGRLTQLKGKKLRFFSAEDRRMSEKLIKHEEFAVFRDILEHKKRALAEQIKNLTRQIEAPQPEQLQIEGIKHKEPKQLSLEAEKWRVESEEKQDELHRIKQALEALRRSKETPFVWDIAFVELFEGENKGFDIVIGNPPYVRQERIAPPTLREDDYETEKWRELKKEYKAKLQESVAVAYPKFFGYKPASGRFRKLPGRSDYYIYFYLNGLSLLNKNGSFCFITSNSWLDVGYGKDFQEFLLRLSHVKMILDNQVKRSFAQSDVNTIIALLAPPDDGKDKGLEHTARFVMFQVPFEEVLHPVIFQEIEEAVNITRRPEFRCIAKGQRELYEEGLDIPEDEEGRKSRLLAKYTGNRWGGRYLRAPDVFFKVLERGKGKLVRLEDIAEVRFGIKTGCNEFFYLPSKHFAIKKEGKFYKLIPKHDDLPENLRIEEEYLVPILKTAKDSLSLKVNPFKLETKLFYCHESIKKIHLELAFDYIKWGEEQGFHRISSVKNRKSWYDVGSKSIPHGIILRRIGERMPIFYANGVLEDCCLFGIIFKKKNNILSNIALLNSTWCRLDLELNTRQLTGAQAVADTNVYVVKDLRVLDVDILNDMKKKELLRVLESLINRESFSIFKELGINPRQPICSQKPNPLPDRKELDDIVFDILGLTQSERYEVYLAVCELVKNRLTKAKSV